MVCLLLKGHVDHNGKMHALLKRTSFVKEGLFQVICFYILGSDNQKLASVGEVEGQSVPTPML